MHRTMGLATIAALLAAAGSAMGQQAFISEMMINAPGTDQGREYVEITGQPGFSLNGWRLIIIEGDRPAGTPPPPPGTWVAGTIDQIIDLSAFTLGTNGVLLIRDSNTLPYLPAPDAGTNAVVRDFNPDLENGGNTYILGFGTLPTQWVVGFDNDTNDDGQLDVPIGAGFTVADAFGYLEGDNPGLTYAAQLGGIDTTLAQQTDPQGNTWTPDALYRYLTPAGGPVAGADGWAFGDVLDNGAGNPTFVWDTVENQFFNIVIAELPGISPGVKNLVRQGGCYPNCDGSTGTPLLTPADFVCFLNRFRAGDAYANCDGSTGTPSLTPADFVCFLNRFRAGC